jgi:hypothetical protein
MQGVIQQIAASPAFNIAAEQPIACGPWVLNKQALDSEAATRRSVAEFRPLTTLVCRQSNYSRDGLAGSLTDGICFRGSLFFGSS